MQGSRREDSGGSTFTPPVKILVDLRVDLHILWMLQIILDESKLKPTGRRILSTKRSLNKRSIHLPNMVSITAPISIMLTCKISVKVTASRPPEIILM